MKFGFISDIHGNYGGLRIALAHLKSMHCEVVCLGDAVSENSDENEACVQLLKRLGVQTVKGQHDDTCAKCDYPPVSQEARKFLRFLPEMMSYGDILCVHDNPLERAREGKGMWRSGSYIRSQLEADAVFSDFFGTCPDIRLVFIGHTHAPKVFTDSAELEIEYGRPIRLAEGRRYIINPGAIGGALRGAGACHTYMSLDQEKDEMRSFRVEVEGIGFIEQCASDEQTGLSIQVQKEWFTPFEARERCDAERMKPASAVVVPRENPLMFHVTELLSVCGYSGIPSQQAFQSYGFKAHLQCSDGFDDWIADYSEVKRLSFDDCAPIPLQVLDSAFSWLKHHWQKGHRVLISCTAGESRSISLAIGFLAVTGPMAFMDACRRVFSAVPGAYPHPMPLLSVANYCGAVIDIDELSVVYDSIQNQPPFPWPISELQRAVAGFASGLH